MLKEKYDLNAFDLLNFNYPKNLENSRDFYNEVTYGIFDFIKYVIIDTEDEFPADKSVQLKLTIKVEGIEGSNGNKYRFDDFFKNMSSINFGQCFVLDISPEIRKQIVRIYFQFIDKKDLNCMHA